jgi:hypothetical protein
LRFGVSETDVVISGVAAAVGAAEERKRASERARERGVDHCRLHSRSSELGHIRQSRPAFGLDLSHF